MPKILLMALLCSTLVVHAQHDFFVYKKNGKVLTVFSQDSYIAFQLQNHEWYAGYVKSVQKDSFWFAPFGVIYGFMQSDTIKFNPMHIALAGVYAMPKEGIQIDYINGRFDIKRDGGHVHWYWIKSGWLYRTLGAGYGLLNITNNLISHNPPFAAKNIHTLAICAGVFIAGVIVKYSYKPYKVLGGRYKLEYE